MKLELARGVKDIDPDEQSMREWIVDKLKTIFINYGCVPLDTPVIERYDVLSTKSAAGDESDAMEETYTLQDNGCRELGLRFDLTVPLARYVGMNKNLKMPFKRYQIGKVYRDSPVKTGRYREFTQCDVDIVGTKDMIADATCIMIAKEAYSTLGVDVTIKVNNRKFLYGLMEEQGVDKEATDSLTMTIDKLDKIGKEGVIKEAEQKGIDPETVKKILNLISMEGSTEEKLSYFKNIIPDNEGLKEMEELFRYFTNNDNVEFTPTLARGLNYYTGTVYEIFDTEQRLESSLGGGGRFDNLIGSYLANEKQTTEHSAQNTAQPTHRPQNTAQPTADRRTADTQTTEHSTADSFPAVGMSFGLDRIVDVLKQIGTTTTESSRTELFIVPLGTKQHSFKIAERFRKSGIPTDIDMIGRGPSKNFKNADKQGIPFVAVIGENEVSEKVITLKDLQTGTEQKLTVEKAIEQIEQNRNNNRYQK